MDVNIKNDGNVGIQSTGHLHVFGGVNVQSTSQMDMDLTEFDLPPLIETFRGRQQEIEELTNFYLNPNIKKVLICGLPGIGKTELAKQFASHCKNNKMVDKIFWVKVEQKEDLKKSFKPLKFIYENNKKFKIIFIFDNAVNRKTIFNIEPPNESNYFLLITSQEKNFSHDIKSLELDLLSFESGLEVYECILMEYYNKTDRELYRQLGEIVGRVPLAVQVTAAFIRERIKATGQSFDLQEYIKEIQKTYFELKIPAWAANPYDKSISGAIAISLIKIKNDVNIQQRELALNTLFTCAFLDSENITFEDLLEMPNIKQLLIENYNKETMLREALTSLDNFSFITYNPNGTQIKIHRFIQTVLRFYTSECDSTLQSKCYSACLESVLFDYKYFNKIKNPIVLKYADENITTFYEFFLKYKKQFLLKCDPAFKEILRWIIQWNCEHVLKKLMDDDLSSVYDNDYGVKSLKNRIRRFFKRTRRFNNNSDKNYIDKFGLLHEAALCDNVKVLRLLLQYDVDINRKETNYLYLDLTPLHIAAYMWNFEFMKILIDHNANIDARDHLGNIPLFRFFSGARFRYQIDYHEAINTLDLLQYRKYRNTRNYSGETILHEAAASCHADLVMLLYGNKMDINVRDYSGYTPLHTLLEELDLCSRGKQDVIETVRALKRCGARLDYKDNLGRTPRQLAKINNIQFLIHIL